MAALQEVLEYFRNPFADRDFQKENLVSPSKGHSCNCSEEKTLIVPAKYIVVTGQKRNHDSPSQVPVPT